MALRIGQRVVCIHPGVIPAAFWAGETDCVVGRVYTVREIMPNDFDGLGPAILVEEITNPIFDDGGECAFYAFRFRPVVERKTDISVFKALLNPTPEDAVAVLYGSEQ